MKIRTSFVANSSSSSFIIFYNNIENIKEIDSRCHDVYCVGRLSDNDSWDFFRMNAEMLKFVQTNSSFIKDKNFEFIHLHKSFRDSWEYPVKREDLLNVPDSFLIKGLEVNNWSTGGIRDMIRSYSATNSEADKWFKLAGLPSTEEYDKASKKLYNEIEDNLRLQNKNQKKRKTK